MFRAVLELLQSLEMWRKVFRLDMCSMFVVSEPHAIPAKNNQKRVYR